MVPLPTAVALATPARLTVDPWLLRYGLYALVVGLPVAYYVHDDLGPGASYRWAWTVGAALTGVAGLFAYLWLRKSEVGAVLTGAVLPASSVPDGQRRRPERSVLAPRYFSGRSTSSGAGIQK